jgi:hypothetical protein
VDVVYRISVIDILLVKAKWRLFGLSTVSSDTDATRRLLPATAKSDERHETRECANGFAVRVGSTAIYIARAARGPG